MILSQDKPRNRPGIYKIENTISKKVYIGSSGRIKRRWNDHVSYLKKNIHHCQHLQNSYNMHLVEFGNDDFLVFEILELMPGSDKFSRLQREEWWINEFIVVGIEVYNSNLKPTNESTADYMCHGRKSNKTAYKPGNVPWTSIHGHDEEARALISEKSKEMWADPESASKLRESRKSEKFRAGRAEDMRKAWINNREKILAGMQTEEYKKRRVEIGKQMWKNKRDEMIASMHKPETMKKFLITRHGAEKAEKLLNHEYLVSLVEKVGKSEAARTIGVGYYVCVGWYKKALRKMNIAELDPEGLQSFYKLGETGIAWDVDNNSDGEIE